jgi:hypothetical protein
MNASQVAVSFSVATFLSALVVVPAYSAPLCVIGNDGVLNIKAGQSIDSALASLKNDFIIVEQPRRDTYDLQAFRVDERLSKKTWFALSVDRGRILFVTIEGPCLTKEGIGVGSTLGEATKVYGPPSLEPSGAGYFIVFKAYSRLSFLLRNEDIPKALRGIPDDALSSKQTRSILGLSKARIEAIQIVSEN